MTGDRLAPRTFYLRALVGGTILILALAHETPARAEMGTYSVRGVDLKPLTENKDSTFDVLCQIGTGCRYGGLFFSSFEAAQVIRQGELEQGFHATEHGTGSVVSFAVAAAPTPTPRDQACWSGKRLGPTKVKGVTLTPDVRECVDVFVKSTPSTKSLSCASTVTVVSSPSQCNTKIGQFASPPSPVDYVLSVAENDFGGKMQVITCNNNVVAQCSTDAPLPVAARVSGFVTFGGFDATSSGGTRYCCK